MKSLCFFVILITCALIIVTQTDYEPLTSSKENKHERVTTAHTFIEVEIKSLLNKELRTAYEEIFDNEASSAIKVAEGLYAFRLSVRKGFADGELPEVLVIGDYTEIEKTIHELRYIKSYIGNNNLEKMVVMYSDVQRGVESGVLDLVDFCTLATKFSSPSFYLEIQHRVLLYEYQERVNKDPSNKIKAIEWLRQLDDKTDWMRGTKNHVLTELATLYQYRYPSVWVGMESVNSNPDISRFSEKSMFDHEENRQFYNYYQLALSSPEFIANLPALITKIGVDDIKEFSKDVFDAYWNNQCEIIAERNNFSIAELRYPSITKPLLDSRVSAVMSGQLSFEVVMLLIPASEIGKVNNVNKAGLSAKSCRNLERFHGLEKLSKSGRIVKTLASRRSILSKYSKGVMGQIDDQAKHFSSLVDPVKLSGLKSKRAGIPRFKKKMAWIYDVERKTGVSYKDIIAASYKNFDGVKPYSNANHVYAPKTEMLNLEAQARLGKLIGLDDPSNIELLKNGKAPIVLKGPHTGEKVHIDHLIPVSKHPELDNSMANLTWLPESLNLQKSDKITNAAIRRMKDLRAEVGWKQ